MTEPLQIIPIPKSSLAEVTRQAAAECTLDIKRCLEERGFNLPPDLRQLFLDHIHTTMLLTVIDLAESRGAEFSDG